MMRRALLAMGLTALAPVAAQASTGCTAINSGVLNHQAVYSAGTPSAGTTAGGIAGTATYHMARSSASWTDQNLPGMNYTPSNATFYTFDQDDQIVVTGNFSITTGTLQLRLRLGSGTNTSTNIAAAAIVTSTSGSQSTVAFAIPAGTTAVGVFTSRNAGATGSIGITVSCTPAVSAPTLNSFTFGSVVAYNPGGASAMNIDVATGGSATNAPTSYAVSSATTSGGGSVSINNAGIASYTPRVGYRGNDTFIATATNSGGTSPPATVTVSVGDPTITAAISGTGARVAAALSGYAVTPAAGNAPYSCVLNGGSAALPGGVTLGANCALTGTPTASGTFSFNVDITDSSVTGANGATPQPFTRTNVPLTGFVIAPEVPTVTSISPIAGPTGGGTTVMINGSGFSIANPTGAVKFGAANATYTIISNTQISATSPAGSAGTVDVTVTTPGGTSATSAADQFTYVAAPTVTSISPTNGPTAGGMTVVITGTGFAAANPTGAVKFGAANASYTINSNTQITATSPANSAGTYDITVTTPGGTSATSAADQYTYVAAPTVTSVSPTAGPTSGGTTVTITGSGFSAAPGTGAVKFGATNATYTINSNTQITATSPARPAGTYDITVTTPGGISATSASDQYTYVAAPVASSHTAAAVAYNAANVNFTLTGHATNSPTNFAVGSATTAQGGSVSVDSAGLVTYTAPTGFRGNDSFVFTATNLGGTSAPATVTVPVSNPTLSFSLAGGSGTRGQALSGVQINASGGRAPYSCGTVPASGSLPAGTALNADCTISGTPVASGTFTFTATVTDSSLGTGPFTQTTGTLSLTIAAPTITLSPASGALPGGTVGTGYSQSFTANGGTATYIYTRTLGTLPTGVTLSGGTLSGTPTAAGTFNFDIRATDSSTVGSGGPYTRTQSYSITIAQGAQTINFGTLSDASLSASPLTLSATASSGLTVSFASTTTSICTVSGTTLTLLQTGACSITASQAGDGNWNAAPDVVRSFTVTPATLTISAAAASGLQVGASYSQANTAAGGVAPYTYTLGAGAFIPGTTVSSTTGVVSGTPTVAGPFSYIIRVSDSQGPPRTADTPMISVTIAKGNQTLSFTSTAPAASVGGAAYTPTVTATSTLTPVLTIDAGSAGICTISGGSVTFNTPGTCLINANQAGDSNWNAAAQVQQAVAVGAASAITTSVNFSTASLGVGQTGTATITFTNLNASASPSIAPLFSGSALVSRGTLGGSCGASGSDSGANFQFNGFSIPSGSCTVTISYTGTTAGSSAGFSLGAFTPSGYPTTAATSGSAFAVVPTVTGVAPPSGPVSQVVTISGTGFSTTPGNNTVTFGSAGNGNVTGASATSLTVTAPAAGSGAKAVTVTVNGQTSTTSATFTFIDKPIAANKPGVTVPYNSTGTAIDLSASITGGPHSSIAIGTAASHGTTTIAGDVVTYTPTAGYFGTDSFTYTATGAGGTSNVATVSLTVATPAAPVAADKNAGIPYNSTGTAIDLTSSITGVHTSIAIGTAPAHGTVTVAGNVVTYTPTAAYFGADSFTYTATGPGGTSAPATVNLTVATPAAPVATDKSGVAVPYASAGTAIDLTSSITGVHTSIAVATAPAHGTVTVAGNVVTYTPSPTHFGADSFTYTATGPGGTSAPATVSVTVANPPAPVAANRSGVAVPYASTGTAIDLTSSITGVHTSIAVASAPAHGTVTVAGNVVTYTPSATYFGTDSFTYTATGPGGTSAPATVSLTVATPAAPVAANRSGVAVPYAGSGTAIDLTSSITGVHTSIAVASAPAHGTVTVAGNVVTYTPSATYFGADSFTYTATGPGGTSAPATVSVTVANPPAPVATDKSGVAVPYASTGTAIDLTSSITGVHTSIAVASAPAHGTVTVAGNVVTYTPLPTHFGADSFTYTATGPGGTSAPATVSVTVANPPAPVAANKSGVAVPYASTGTAIDLTSSITGVHTSIAVASAPAHGTVTVAGNVVTYTPSATYFGADSFTYTATGPGGTSAPATVSLTVATPAAPVAANRSGVAVPYAGSGTAIDLTSSITGVHTSIAVASAPAHGTVTVAGNVVTYTPSATYFGADSFTYTATGPGGTSAPATVSVTVAVPPAPTVADRSGIAVPYASSGTAIDLTSSIAGVHTSIAVASAPAHGTVTVAGNVVTYTPSATYFGADSFTYTATGPGGTSAPATVSLTVATPPAPTVADRSGVAVPYASSGTAIDLTGSITGVHTSIAVASAPAHGTVTVSGNVVTYTPSATYFGADSFTYTATGPGGTSAPATVSLTVAVPPAPAVADRSGVAVPYAGSGTAIDLTSSITGVHTSIAVASAPAHGTVTVSGNVVTYTPSATYFGADSFTYTATGPGGTSAPATVSVTVAVPPAPAVADRSGVAVPYAGSGTAIDLTGSITGVHTSIAIATAPAHGTATVAGNVVTYTPSATYFGADSFTYTATGPGGTSAPATVSLTVATPPAPTVANRSGVAVAYNSPGTAIDLTSSITGVHTSIAITTAPTHGTATVSGNVVTYVPTAGYYGADSFAYTATGPGGTSTPATVGLVVANPPAPVAAPGTGTVTGNTALTNNTVAVDLSALVTGVHSAIQIATQPAHGTVTLSAGAPYLATYKPAVNYAGTDSFTFVAVGPGGTSTPGTVTITVVGQTPVALPKTAATGDGQMVSVMLTDGATGGPFTGANVVSVSPAGSVATTIVAAGNGTYRLDATPSNRFGGTIVVTYTLSNAFGASAPSTVTLTVQARPDPRNDPVVGAISDAQAETARRFARAQVSNFMRRAEQLHNDGGGSGSAMGITLSSRDGTGVMNQFDDSSWGLTITDRMRRSSEDPAIGRVANDPRSPFSRVDRLGDGRMLATSGGVLGDAQPRLGVGKADEAEAPGSGFVDEDGKRRNGSVALWAGGAIEIGTRNETTDRSKITATTAGLSGGADIKLADGVVVGVGGGYGNDLSRIGTAAQVRGTSSLFAAYASILPVDGLFIDGMVGRGQLDFTTRRFVTAVNAEARGSRDGSYTVAALSLGIDRGDGPLQWSIYGRGEYLDADLDAYAESGAGRYNLRFDAREVRSVVGTIGGRIQYRQKVSFGSITPRLRAEWNHEFADIDPQWLDYADIPGAAFYSLSGNGWSREQIQLNLGTRFDLLASRWSLDFETGWRGGQGGHAGTLQLRVSRRF